MATHISETKKWFTTLQILCRLVAVAEIGRIYNTWDRLAKQWKLPEGLYSNCEFTEVWICKGNSKIEFTIERAYALGWLINSTSDEAKKWEHFHTLAAKLAEDLDTKQLRCQHKGLAVELAKDENKKYRYAFATTGRFFELTGSRNGNINCAPKTLSLRDDIVPLLGEWLQQHEWEMQLELSLIGNEWRIVCYVVDESRKVMTQSTSLTCYLQDKLGVIEPIQTCYVLDALTQIQ
jgi:hypothetical protein